jgi:hypothetical protein
MNCEREDLETRREFRYALMRLARFPGYIIFYGGIGVVCFGLVFFLLGLPEALAAVLSFIFRDGGGGPSELYFHGHPFYQTMLGMGIIIVGFFGISLGPAITGPYSFATTMPSTYVRVCHGCEEPLPNQWIIHTCPKCGMFMPLGPLTYFVRFVSVAATWVNITILLTGLLFTLR